jgi:hypothetical protein
MTNRNPIVVFILCFVTFYIYQLIWLVKTKEEMNSSAQAGIPTAWLLIVPIANLFWLWKWSEGVGKATNGGYSGAVAFLLMWILGPIGAAILQAKFNEVAAAAPAA